MSWIDEDTEAAHLAEIEDEDIDGWSEDDEDPGSWYEDDNARERRENSRKSFESKRQKGVDDNEKHYLKNKEAKVGTQITCAGPLCNKHFKKVQYAQAFCCSKCKDQFWNRREAHYGYRKPI